MWNGRMSVLLVEDDEVEATAVMRSFRNLKIDHTVVVAHDGVEALQRLRCENGYKRLPTPLVILLDLSMPRMGGHEFLQELRHDPSLHRTTVFVMTASTAEKDRALAYKNNVAGYIVKDGRGQNLAEVISMLRLYCQMVAAA